MITYLFANLLSSPLNDFLFLQGQTFLKIYKITLLLLFISKVGLKLISNKRIDASVYLFLDTILINPFLKILNIILISLSLKLLGIQSLIMTTQNLHVLIKWMCNPFQHCVACHIETSHLICSANQMTGFYIKYNTGIKWVNSIQLMTK